MSDTSEPEGTTQRTATESNYQQRVSVVRESIMEATSLIIEDETPLPALIEQFDFLMNAGKFHQVMVLNNSLQELFASYTYLFLERCIREGDATTADTSLERYQRTGVGMMHPITKFWN